jgi:hypothetical protein
MMIQFGAAITAQIGRTCRFSWPAHQLEPSAKKLAVIDQKASLMLAKVSRIHQTPSNPLFALVADPLRWIEVAATLSPLQVSYRPVHNVPPQST